MIPRTRKIKLCQEDFKQSHADFSLSYDRFFSFL